MALTQHNILWIATDPICLDSIVHVRTCAYTMNTCTGHIHTHTHRYKLTIANDMELWYHHGNQNLQQQAVKRASHTLPLQQGSTKYSLWEMLRIAYFMMTVLHATGL